MDLFATELGIYYDLTVLRSHIVRLVHVLRVTPVDHLASGEVTLTHTVLVGIYLPVVNGAALDMLVEATHGLIGFQEFHLMLPLNLSLHGLHPCLVI